MTTELAAALTASEEERRDSSEKSGDYGRSQSEKGDEPFGTGGGREQVRHVTSARFFFPFLFADRESTQPKLLLKFCPIQF